MAAEMHRPGSIAEIAERSAAGMQPFDLSVREFLDSWQTMSPQQRSAALDEAPDGLGKVMDAYLAALAEHLALSERLLAPAWTEQPHRFLSEPFFSGGMESLKAILACRKSVSISPAPHFCKRRWAFASKPGARLIRTCAALLFGFMAIAHARAADLDKILVTAMAGTKTPALGVLVMRHGRVAGIAVRGVRRIDRSDAVRPSDVWLIGSDAKPMTATLIAGLVDRGVLSWTAPLAKMLPGLAAKMRPEYRNVTLVQLLSHRAGLPHDYHDVNYFMTFFADKRPLTQQRYDYIAHALTDKPVAPPGTKFSYSNTGFMIAAVIAERKTGVPYESLMRRDIFEPLGMKSAGFGTTPPGQPQGHRAGKVATLKDANPLMFAPAGNIHMSLGDWAAFCLDQMAGYHGHGRLLRPATYRMMETRLPGAQTGLAWGVEQTALGRQGPALEHAGSDGNWMALVVLFPQSENGALIAANAGPDMGGEKAAKAALKAVLPQLAPPAAAPVTPAR